jgi:hypothetical protein
MGGGFRADGLRWLGKRLLSYVAPDVEEAQEAAALARDEAAAYANRTLSISDAGDGRVRVRGWLDTEAAAIVSAALDPLCSPRRSARALRNPDGASDSEEASLLVGVESPQAGFTDWEVSSRERAAPGWDDAVADERTPPGNAVRTPSWRCAGWR